MRAYRFDTFGGLDGLTVHDEPRPRPQRGEVLLRVRAVSLNYRDVAMPFGRYPIAVEPGRVPTSDGAAEVVEVGKGVETWTPGDRVIGLFHPRWFGGPAHATLHAESYGGARDGWLSEHKVVSQEAIVRLPDALSFEAGSTLPCAAATAWNALGGAGPVRAGDVVLTQGTGGVSIFAVQLAKALGARVIATTSSAAKGDRLSALGADGIIDYAQVKDWGAEARVLTGGRGVDRVVEVGGPSTIGQSLKAVATGGAVVLIGFLSKDNPGIDFFELMSSGAHVYAITVGDRPNLEGVVRAVAQHQIEPVIDRVFDFDDAKAAFAHLEAGKHIGKVVIRV